MNKGKNMENLNDMFPDGDWLFRNEIIFRKIYIYSISFVLSKWKLK